MSSEVAERTDFSIIRYAQCWEDADVLLAGLAPAVGARCLSICSAGDNALALLIARPSEVVAVDLSEAQLACLDLRISAYRALEHDGLLELIGSRPSTRRMALYQRCRQHGGLTDRATSFWDRRGDLVRRGIGEAGRFERYFRIFRRSVLPLIHSRSRVNDLLRPKPRAERERFYSECWDNRRWRLLFRLFFSRSMMGLLGRDPSFFKYVEGSVADRILARARHALVELEPADNPYLHWIVTGTHGDALPLALRPEHFATIRDHVDRVHGHVCSIEELLGNGTTAVPFDAFNLSDIFEYMSVEATESLLRHLVAAARPGAALLWWNMLAPRGVPESMRHCLDSETERAEALHGLDSAFFYSRVVIARVIGQC